MVSGEIKNTTCANDFSKLFSAMSEGPSVLLLGQDVLSNYGGEDYFLNACKDRFNLEHAENYDDLISNCGESDDLMSVWHAISTRIAVPDAFEKLAALPWNCVLTSAFHEVIDRGLAADWRSVSPVLDDNTIPSDPRSRTKLSVYKLFGCVTRDRRNEQPPFNDEQQMQRNMVAAAMLRQLPSLVTPKGTLFVDSLSQIDWLGTKELSEAIAHLGIGQAHFFGATPDTKAVREIKSLLRLNKIILHEETLGEALARLDESEYGKLVTASRTWVEGIEFTFQTKKKHVFKPSEWRRLTNGATLLTDADANTKYEFTSPDEKYRRFREFLYGSHGVPNWQAVATGLAFRRQEFDALKSTVLDALDKKRLNEEPILVAGQSGSGKTVALSDLAVAVRRQGWPVLFFGRNHTDIDSGLIETICGELDRIENTSVLLIWDASLAYEQYSSLASYLASRGRKVLVVGSSYKTDSRGKCVEFAQIMGAEDAKKFRKHLESFDKTLVEDVEADQFERRNFWAWLWRLLPESRGRLRLGLLGEVETHEQKLEASLRSTASEAPVAVGTLGSIFAEAGIYGSQTDETENINVRDLRGQAATQVERLRGLILVPSSFGQDVPIDLVLRCLGREGFEVLRHALQNTPVYRWVEDEYGNHSLGGRQQLESQTIVRTTFSRSERMEFVKTLLRNVRSRGDWRIFNFEVDFALRLLKSVGPDSPLQSPSSEELLELATVLEEMTTNSGTDINPWLVFHEGFFRREALMRKVRDDLDWDNAVDLAREVPALVSEYELATAALARAESAYTSFTDRKHRRGLSRIHTEYAALCGLAQNIEQKISDIMPNSSAMNRIRDAMSSGFGDAVDHCKKAAVFDSENYYSQDVLFRVTSTQLKSEEANEEVTDEARVELISELCDILDHESWRLSQEQYNRRKLELAGILNDDSIKQEALQRLAELGSTAGEYMLAWRGMYFPDRKWRGDSEIESALKRIESVESRVDLRLARLYTQGWWKRFGRVDLYESERNTAALRRQQWEHIGGWLSRRLAFVEEESLTSRFLYAWSLFQTGQYRESEEQFRLLDRSTMAGRYRVVRLCLWSEEDGEPINCKGTIRRISQDGDKGWVYVPQLRREISFRPNEFSEQTILSNKPLEDFHIAFNFRGPIADPARMYRGFGRARQ